MTTPPYGGWQQYSAPDNPAAGQSAALPPSHPTSAAGEPAPYWPAYPTAQPTAPPWQAAYAPQPAYPPQPTYQSPVPYRPAPGVYQGQMSAYGSQAMPPVPYAIGIPGVPPKETSVAYLLWFFLGGVGAHHFYLRRTGHAVAYLCAFVLGFVTVGFGFIITAILLLVDLFMIPQFTRRANGLPY